MPTHKPPGRGARGCCHAAWRGEAPVFCIAGRGPLDDAAAAILRNCCIRDGLKARVCSTTPPRVPRIGRWTRDGVAMVCLCYLEIGGTPSHLRYLLRRLRQRLPAVRLLVGMWPADQAILTDDRLRAAVGADYYASSLREAVEACLEAARSDTPATAVQSVSAPSGNALADI